MYSTQARIAILLGIMRISSGLEMEASNRPSKNWFCAPHPLCTWPQQSLAGINLSVDSIPESEEDDSGNSIPRVFLWGIELPEANLGSANLQGADLRSANLAGTYLGNANLERADLRNSNLAESYLGGVNLAEAYLGSVNLEGAYLGGANLAGARLANSNLAGAYLVETNLAGVSLGLPHLIILGDNVVERSIMDLANLQGASLYETNLQGTEHLTKESVSQAMLCKTVLPDYITLDPDRDCDELERRLWQLQQRLLQKTPPL